MTTSNNKKNGGGGGGGGVDENFSVVFSKSPPNDDGVLTFIYHQAIEEVECGNCHSKVIIDNLSSTQCVVDCDQHKDHECELKLGYGGLKFTNCGNACHQCQGAILYKTCLEHIEQRRIKETVESSTDEDDNKDFGYDTDSLKKADADADSDDDDVGDWYTNRNGYQACRYCRSKGNGDDECDCTYSHIEHNWQKGSRLLKDDRVVISTQSTL